MSSEDAAADARPTRRRSPETRTPLELACDESTDPPRATAFDPDRPDEGWIEIDVADLVTLSDAE